MTDTLPTPSLSNQRYCAWCNTLTLRQHMAPVVTEVDPDTGIATAEVYVCDPCLEPLRQQQKEHDDSCEPMMPDEKFMHLANGG